MVSSEERIKVLEMISEGKIGVDEGATLLKSLEGPGHAPRLRRDTADQRKLHVRVDDANGGKLKVNVVLPMALVNAGLNIAGRYLDDESNEYATTLVEAIDAGETGKILDVLDAEDGEHVQVFIE